MTTTKLSKRPKKIKSKKLYISDFITTIATTVWRNYHKMPYPILKYLLRNNGAWAGSSITEEASKRSWDARKKQYGKLSLKLVFALTIIVVFVLGLTTTSDNFFFGFSQELLSELILILFLIFFLEKIQNGDKSMHFRGYYIIRESEENINHYDISIHFENTGNVVISERGLRVELILPGDTAPIIENSWNSETYMTNNKTSTWDGEVIKVVFTNQVPIYQYQNVKLIGFRHKPVVGNDGELIIDPVFFYRVYTSNASYPLPWNASEYFVEQNDGNMPKHAIVTLRFDKKAVSMDNLGINFITI